MRVVTPTASGASCVLGLQRAWAQPRRTDSSTCSATSSHTPSVGISQLECTCGKKKMYGVGGKKVDRGAGAGKGPSARRGQKTQRPAFSHSFVGVCTPLVCTAGLSFCPCCSASAELTTRLFSASAELTTHLLVSASAELTTHIFSSGSTPPLYRRGKTTQRALRSAILSLESALPCS